MNIDVFTCELGPLKAKRLTPWYHHGITREVLIPAITVISKDNNHGSPKIFSGRGRGDRLTDLYIACPGQAVRNSWNPHYCITLGNGFINRCGQRDRKKTGKQDRNGKRISRGDRRIPEGDSLVEVE